MIDVARNVCARDHARCETRRGRDACVWTKRVFLNAKSSIESRKKCRMASHFLERFSQKRDEISEYTPTFQGRQKMIKCVRSSLRSRVGKRSNKRERAIDVSFPSAKVLFRTPESWGFREIAGEKNIIIIRKRSDLFFFFFFLSDCSNGFDSIFLSLNTTNVCVI